jgi:hypothetical protein
LLYKNLFLTLHIYQVSGFTRQEVKGLPAVTFFRIIQTMNYPETFKKYALSIPDILLPRDRNDLSRWAVIACDQYTQDRSYWKSVADCAGTNPSTLNIILPEVYLEDGDRRERLAQIRTNMKTYLGNGTEKGVFDAPVHGFIYIERKTAYGRIRKGLVAAIDLDSYDWKPDSTALTRATEATIVDRIPPRMEIRRGAPVESPHIMLLVNDPGKTLVESLGSRVRTEEPLYSTQLMAGSGSVTGWQVSEDADLAYAADALAGLARAGSEKDGSVFLFAVGDGNHSLATAKAVWEEYRAAHPREIADGTIDGETCPVRFALAEIVNLYDDGLTFEPIHRVLFGPETADIPAYLAEKLGGSLHTLATGSAGEDSAENAKKLETLVSGKTTTRFGFVSGGKLSYLDTPDPALAVSRLQPALDDFLATCPGTRIDYIHGAEEVFRLGREKDTMAILLPPVEKDSFFATISTNGPLPRKSFSMGEASEKRFYIECRKLFD